MPPKIYLTDTTGRQVTPTPSAIQTALQRYTTEGGFSHVTFTLESITIWRWRNTKRETYHYYITESTYEHSKYADILETPFTADELDKAVEYFLRLCKTPTKVRYNTLINKLGNFTVFPFRR